MLSGAVTVPGEALRARTGEPWRVHLRPTVMMRKTTLLLSLAVAVLAGCADQAPAGTSKPPALSHISTCGVVMKASYDGHALSLGSCAGYVGLRPVPRLTLAGGQILTLLAPIKNDRPPLPVSRSPDILRLVETNSGITLGAFKAERPGTAKLIIKHPPKTVCVPPAKMQCVVAVVIVRDRLS
jgi:hypothetical protein